MRNRRKLDRSCIGAAVALVLVIVVALWPRPQQTLSYVTSPASRGDITSSSPSLGPVERAGASQRSEFSASTGMVTAVHVQAWATQVDRRPADRLAAIDPADAASLAAAAGAGPARPRPQAQLDADLAARRPARPSHPGHRHRPPPRAAGAVRIAAGGSPSGAAASGRRCGRGARPTPAPSRAWAYLTYAMNDLPGQPPAGRGRPAEAVHPGLRRRCSCASSRTSSSRPRSPRPCRPPLCPRQPERAADGACPRWPPPTVSRVPPPRRAPGRHAVRHPDPGPAPLGDADAHRLRAQPHASATPSATPMTPQPVDPPARPPSRPRRTAPGDLDKLIGMADQVDGLLRGAWRRSPRPRARRARRSPTAVQGFAQQTQQATSRPGRSPGRTLEQRRCRRQAQVRGRPCKAAQDAIRDGQADGRQLRRHGDRRDDRQRPRGSAAAGPPAGRRPAQTDLNGQATITSPRLRRRRRPRLRRSASRPRGQVGDRGRPDGAVLASPWTCRSPTARLVAPASPAQVGQLAAPSRP
jgi:hypothetical protein